jgi:hypothetical protein
MLRLVRLVEQWRSVEEQLPAGWAEARLELELADERQAARAAAVLGPANPGRGGSIVRFDAARGGGGIGPDAVAGLLRRLDREGIAGTLRLMETREREARTAAAEEGRPALVAAWERELDGLPDDWSDLHVEVVLRSSDQLERAALMLAPLNPTRYGDVTGFRFRCAREFGYGASPQMVRRCFERCDAERITGTVRILRALSDTRPVATQGPVWYVGGKAV